MKRSWPESYVRRDRLRCAPCSWPNLRRSLSACFWSWPTVQVRDRSVLRPRGGRAEVRGCWIETRHRSSRAQVWGSRAVLSLGKTFFRSTLTIRTSSRTVQDELFQLLDSAYSISHSRMFQQDKTSEKAPVWPERGKFKRHQSDLREVSSRRWGVSGEKVIIFPRPTLPYLSTLLQQSLPFYLWNKILQFDLMKKYQS